MGCTLECVYSVQCTVYWIQRERGVLKPNHDPNPAPLPRLPEDVEVSQFADSLPIGLRTDLRAFAGGALLSASAAGVRHFGFDTLRRAPHHTQPPARERSTPTPTTTPPPPPTATVRAASRSDRSHFSGHIMHDKGLCQSTPRVGVCCIWVVTDMRTKPCHHVAFASAHTLRVVALKTETKKKKKKTKGKRLNWGFVQHHGCPLYDRVSGSTLGCAVLSWEALLGVLSSPRRLSGVCCALLGGSLGCAELSQAALRGCTVLSQAVGVRVRVPKPKP